MKAAAAVLGASLLFFLGVLTGTGRRESVPPPAAIPLGVVDQSASDGTGSQSPAPDAREPTATTPTTSTAGPAPAPTGPARPPAPADPSTPAGPPGAPGPPGSAGTTATTAPAATTSTTARPGKVEEVDGEVDCSRGNGKGKGGRESCPPATAGRDGDGTGGGSGR